MNATVSAITPANLPLGLIINSTDKSHTRYQIRLGLSIIYGILFTIGIIGNLAVIFMVINILTTLKRVSLRSQHYTKHVFIYVLGLSIVDLMVLMHLPFLIIDIQHRNWKFGQIFCKIYWTLESVNKILSTMFLSALSFDRYLAICHPLSAYRLRNQCCALVILLSCTVLGFVLLMPIPIYATISKLDNDSSSAVRCTFGVPPEFRHWFTGYTFATGYLIPGILLVIFYTLVLVRLKRNQDIHNKLTTRRKSTSSEKGMKERSMKSVTARILSVVLFYFICWTPQWLMTWLGALKVITVNYDNLLVVTVYYFAHVMVCVNSSANPIFYAWLNSELREQNNIAFERRRTSFNRATKRALESLAKSSRHLVVHANVNETTHTGINGCKKRRKSQLIMKSTEDQNGLPEIQEIPRVHKLFNKQSTDSLQSQSDNDQLDPIFV